MKEVLVRVVAPHFVAGFVTTKEKVVRAAPILAWTVGRPPAWVASRFRRNGWDARRVEA